jgi:hypothetical protein
VSQGGEIRFFHHNDRQFLQENRKKNKDRARDVRMAVDLGDVFGRPVRRATFQLAEARLSRRVNNMTVFPGFMDITQSGLQDMA